MSAAIAFARAVGASFVSDECLFLAGAVAYQLFFALIPMLALVVGVLAFVFGPDRAQRELIQLFRQIYPSATSQEVRIARELVDGRALSLGIGVVGTLFGATAVHGSVESALGAVLGRTRKRSFIRGHAEGLAFVGAIALIAVFSFALSYGAQAAQGALAAAGLGGGTRLLIAVGSPLLGLAAGYVFFFLIYRYVPRTPVPRRVVRWAALVSAVLWEGAKVAFGFFTRGLGVFSAYGPIAFAAGLLTWVYVTAVIILVGAEVMKVRTRA
ncbi:MAG TPA: YihY/virulence factor BrkB family protein [Candidatus Limnocylindria bacterium]|nr:YihY/virulence factor BrkB family protein [Candidatus Limnocylindria bacterium]